jgi:hypothetical protein
MFERLRRLLRRGPHQYDGSGFSVSVQSIGRELVRVIYTREGRTLDLVAGCYGAAPPGIVLEVPKDLAADLVGQMVRDLSEGFARLGYGYEIYRAGEPQVVPEQERQQALAELRTMGMEATVEDDMVRTTRLPGYKPPPKEVAVAYGIRLMKLARTVSGTRVPIEVLASGKPPVD